MQRRAIQQQLEYLAVRTLLFIFGMLPRSASRRLGEAVAAVIGALPTKLARTGRRNLELAYPEKAPAERQSILDEVFRSLGWLLAEFAQMRGYSAERARAEIMRYEGLTHYLAAERRGKGVLVLTGHLGAWELSSYLHSLLGYPMGMVIRRLDNPLVDELVNGIRCQHGNWILHKDDFARGLVRAMHRGETVGILMDTNMTPPQGVFVPFFGRFACTASGLAKVAGRTEAAVLPGFLLWHESEQRYVLTFGPELQLQRTGDSEADAVANTALFAAVTEDYIRRYPGQWLWLHRRWKTQLPGAGGLY